MKRLSGLLRGSRFSSKTAILAAVIAGGVFSAEPACAALLYWSNSATWDNGATADWGTASGGPYNASVWNSGADAVFQGTAGTVTVNSPITSVSSMTFTTDGYTLSGAGSLTLTGTGSITTGAATDTIGGNTALVIGGSVGLTKLGTGILALNGNTADTFTNGLTINGGTVNLDNTNFTAASNLIDGSNALTLGGGTLGIVARSNTATSQGLGNLTLNMGSSTLKTTKTGTGVVTFNLGALTTTAAAGSLLVNNDVAQAGVFTTTTNKDATGIYGGRVVYFNGTASTGYDWATTVSAGPTYTLSAYSGYTAMVAGATSDTANDRVTASLTLTGAHTHNSLKIENPATGQTLALGANLLTLNSGGILVTGASVTTGFTISGMSGATRLTAGNGSGSYDLIIHQESLNALNLNAVVGDNVVGGTHPTNLVIDSAVTDAASSETHGAVFIGAVNTFTGGVFILGGSVKITGSGVFFPASTVLTIGNTGAYNFNSATGTHTFAGINDINGGTGGVVWGGGASTARTLLLSGGGTYSFNGNLGGSTPTKLAVTIALTGSGVQSLGGASTFNQGLIIQSGILAIPMINNAGVNGPLGANATVTLGSNATATGTLRYTGATASSTMAFALNGTSAGAGAVDVSTAATTLTLSGAFSGGGNFVKTGAGVLTFSNAANSYTGTTTVTAGTLIAGAAVPASGNGDFGAATSTINVGDTSAGSILNAALLVGNTGNNPFNIARNISIQSLGAGGAQTATLGAFNTAGVSNFTGNIALNRAVILQAATGGTASFNTGAWTANNNNVQIGSTGNAGKVVIANTLTTSGAVSVVAGTLNLTGTLDGGGSAITVGSGAVLSGNGTLGKNVSVSSGGTLQPGASPGTLTYNNANLALNSGGNLNLYVLNATGTAGAGYSTNAITGTGALDLSGLTVGPNFNINLWSLSSIAPDVNGNATNFVNTNSYSWTIVSTPSVITGFNAALFTVNTAAANGTSGFSNALGSGTFSVGLTNGGKDLSVLFTSGGSTVSVVPSSGNLLATNNAVAVNISGGSATLTTPATSGQGWSTTGVTAGSYSSNQSLNTVAATTGRLNGTMRGRTSFNVSGAVTGNGTYSYTLSNAVSGQTAAVGSGTSFGATQSSTLLSGDTVNGYDSVEAGGLNSHLYFRGSTVLAADADVSVAWRNRSSLEAYPGSTPPLPAGISQLISDVAQVSVSSAGTPFTSGNYLVIEVSYDPATLGGASEAIALEAGKLYLARMTEDGNGIYGDATDSWANASNVAYDGVTYGVIGAPTSTVGDWGIETSGLDTSASKHYAWAVIDPTTIDATHDQFAVVPEPASLGLLALGALGLMRRRR